MGDETGTTTEQDDWVAYFGVKFDAYVGASDGEADAVVPGQAAGAVSAARTAYPPRSTAPKHAVTAGENTALSKLPPDQLAKQDLTQRDATGLFTEDYMGGLVGLKMKGANDPKLKEDMRKLAKGMSPGERKAVIEEVAKLRGVDPAKLD